jgi:hypothetical protein
VCLAHEAPTASRAPYFFLYILYIRTEKDTGVEGSTPTGERAPPATPSGNIHDVYTTYTRHPVAAGRKAFRIWISQKKRPPRVEPRRASPESGKGSVVSDDQPAATQGTQVDCVHLTLLMYDSPRSRANKLFAEPAPLRPLVEIAKSTHRAEPISRRATSIFIGRRLQPSKKDNPCPDQSCSHPPSPS